MKKELQSQRLAFDFQKHELAPSVGVFEQHQHQHGADNPEKDGQPRWLIGGRGVEGSWNSRSPGQDWEDVMT
jgi:hypothetical protein